MYYYSSNSSNSSSSSGSNICNSSIRCISLAYQYIVTEEKREGRKEREDHRRRNRWWEDNLAISVEKGTIVAADCVWLMYGECRASRETKVFHAAPDDKERPGG